MKRREFLGLVGAGVCGLAATNVFATPKHPNFVFIQGEAQGWTSMSVPIDDRISNSVSDLFYTPNLARLAKGGMRFSNFYAPSPRCTPSRASYLTGKSPTKLHMTFVNQRVGNTKLIPPTPVLEMPTEEIIRLKSSIETNYKEAKSSETSSKETKDISKSNCVCSG